MNAQKHILIVDGDVTARIELARELARLGYSVSHVGSIEAASLALSRVGLTDMVLVDSQLPDGRGRDMITRLRRRGMMLPAILLTDGAREDDVVAGLDAGADDVMARPLRMREFAARIRAQFRLSFNRDDMDLRVGLLTFRPSTRTVFQPYLPAPVQLTEKEAALLARLCRADGRPVSRETLLREVWGYSPNVASHTVETHVYRLRRKIEAGGDTPQIILNDDNGYRLAVTEPAEGGEAAKPAAWPAGSTTQTLHSPLRLLTGAIR
jgi:DNA-binding response OmpR family regulator